MRLIEEDDDKTPSVLTGRNYGGMNHYGIDGNEFFGNYQFYSKESAPETGVNQSTVLGDSIIILKS
jgi:hypothetical protein